MRAAILAAPGEIRVEDVAVPEPAAGEVRVRIEGCGVCASNLEPWGGNPWTQYPGEPGGLGHEGWGIVEAVGAGVAGLVPGDRVAALSYRSFAESDIASAEMVVKLPESLADKPFPGEPLGCAFNIFRRGDIRAGDTIAIVGIGFLGTVLTRLASEAGARVIAISRRTESLDLARHYGAAETIVMDDHYRIIEQVQALTNGKGCERVIECVGKQWPLDLGGRTGRVRRTARDRRLSSGRATPGQHADVELEGHRRHQRARARSGGTAAWRGGSGRCHSERAARSDSALFTHLPAGTAW